MTAEWVRRAFASDGVTEHPVGPSFERLRARFGGALVLALDVSGSMEGSRLKQATRGSHRFIDEAVDAGYSVGVILWHHGVRDTVAPATDPARAHRLVDRARAGGGTSAVPFLALAHEQLMALEVGDRVVAIFGDGDLGDRTSAESKAAQLTADDIRILTCGLGDASATELATISTEGVAPRSAEVGDLAEAIASMANGLIRKR